MVALRIEPLTDRAGCLLDELDSFIAELDDIMRDQAAARLVIGDAESEQAIIEASLTLTTDGKNEAARKAALTLALAEDAGYQRLAAVVREARAALFDADRRLSVVKARMALVRAALALHVQPLTV